VECFCATTSKPEPFVKVRLFYVDGSQSKGCWNGEEWEHEREEVHPVSWAHLAEARPKSSASSKVDRPSR